jgi:hypothetical protein
MAENTENVRGDSGVREDKGKQSTNWSGRKFVLPRGTTLPAVTAERESAEVFVLQKTGASDQLYIFDTGINNWVTVGP